MALKGLNIGGWLLMEGYILHGRNIAESTFKKAFLRVNGADALRSFEQSYRSAFISEDDFKRIAELKANVVRLPFNCRLIEDSPYCYSQTAFTYLDKALEWGKKYGLKIILDLHAAPGAQNHDWHGDSTDGKARFWDKVEYRERAVSLWEAIAERYREHPALAGYDAVNEPVLSQEQLPLLKSFYRSAIQRIKAIDPHHTIFIEGNNWAQQIDFLQDILEDNVSVSIHTYMPLSYTFNFRPFYTFPGKIDGELWSNNRIRKYLAPYRRFSERTGARIFVGEFGIKWRGGFYGEREWLDGILSIFDEYDFDYTYWTYKAVANGVFPDGVYQYVPDTRFVRREGPVYGWENYTPYWKTDQKEIIDSWKTDGYTANKGIIEILRKHFAGSR
jgi:hypothetical protein